MCEGQDEGFLLPTMANPTNIPTGALLVLVTWIREDSSDTTDHSFDDRQRILTEFLLSGHEEASMVNKSRIALQVKSV
jgi:hypothetical protein